MTTEIPVFLDLSIVTGSIRGLAQSLLSKSIDVTLNKNSDKVNFQIHTSDEPPVDCFLRYIVLETAKRDSSRLTPDKIQVSTLQLTQKRTDGTEFFLQAMLDEEEQIDALTWTDGAGHKLELTKIRGGDNEGKMQTTVSLDSRSPHAPTLLDSGQSLTAVYIENRLQEVTFVDENGYNHFIKMIPERTRSPNAYDYLTVTTNGSNRIICARVQRRREGSRMEIGGKNGRGQERTFEPFVTVVSDPRAFLRLLPKALENQDLMLVFAPQGASELPPFSKA